jgi:murein tripeptide amidase MpaA
MIGTILISCMIFFQLNNNQQMLVRVYTDDYRDLKRIELKSLDIAGRRYQEYFDIVVSPEEYRYILSSGLNNEIIEVDLELAKDRVRGQYHSYTEVRNILEGYASSYPSICKFDSIGLSHEGYWIYALKISDNPQVEDDTEAGALFDALHHSREWATIETILFYADTLTSGYGSDPTITSLVDNTEIWLIPIVNVDGYRYDYPGGNDWRKDRKWFLGACGTDPNRNYNGALNEDPHGDWGSIPDNGQVTHYPSFGTFCGAYAGWSDCISHMMEFHRTHDINANISYHSFAEEVIWPWAYTSRKTPDSTLYEAVAQGIASRIHRVGSGYYQATGSLYPNTGTTRTWVYGIHHYVWGTSALGFTIEIGTSFYQPVGDLDYIARENWKGALYLALKADSIRNYVVPEVPSPILSAPDTGSQDSFTVYWEPVLDQYSTPDLWQLDHLEGYSYGSDDIESGTGNWILDGFSQNSTRSHSGNYSLFSGSANNMSNVAMTEDPYFVSTGDTFCFWCWYDLETNYDVAIPEVSTDMNEWIQLDQRFSSTSGGWQYKSYTLDQWVGEAVYFRLRAMCDDYSLDEGFYVDDIYPVSDFSSISTISSSITDTFYTLTSVPVGTHYYRVSGHNYRGWGNYSNIEEVYVPAVGVGDEGKIPSKMVCDIFSDLRNIHVSYVLPHACEVKISLYDASGRVVRESEGRRSAGAYAERFSTETSGVFFVRVRAGEREFTEKVVTLR